MGLRGWGLTLIGRGMAMEENGRVEAKGRWLGNGITFSHSSSSSHSLIRRRGEGRIAGSAMTATCRNHSPISSILPDPTTLLFYHFISLLNSRDPTLLPMFALLHFHAAV